MRTKSATAVTVFLLVVRLGCMTILLVDYFMCMIVLMLRTTYGQVVLLQIVLNFVTYNWM
jgi:hypothetical protein